MNIGQNIQQAKRGMVPNATIVAQEISGNTDMSLVQTLKGITSVISATLSYIEREESSKTHINAAEAVFNMKVCFSAAKNKVHQAGIDPIQPVALALSSHCYVNISALIIQHSMKI